MQKWEYITVDIRREITKRAGFLKGEAESAWIASFEDGTSIKGVDNVLNHLGVHGWELVNVIPNNWGQIGFAMQLTAYFKRPKSKPASEE
jgi:hypothetical protein